MKQLDEQRVREIVREELEKDREAAAKATADRLVQAFVIAAKQLSDEQASPNDAILQPFCRLRPSPRVSRRI
jgi:hypothetical protein